jgi:NADH:ubiquinone oxidoreductase subunit 6 (subunit J)
MARYGQNALEVIHNLKEKIAEVSSGLPQGVTIEAVYDRSDLIHRAIDTLKRTLLEESLIVALVCVVLVGVQVFWFLGKGGAAFQIAQPGILPAASALGNTEQLADVLFQEYLLPFEIASILLLVAVVGSVVMAKKRI